MWLALALLTVLVAWPAFSLRSLARRLAHYVLGWAWRPSWLVGVALSTTSVAVVYAVMLELGFNRTTYGKAILAACFINDRYGGRVSEL